MTDTPRPRRAAGPPPTDDNAPQTPARAARPSRALDPELALDPEAPAQPDRTADLTPGPDLAPRHVAEHNGAQVTVQPDQARSAHPVPESTTAPTERPTASESDPAPVNEPDAVNEPEDSPPTRERTPVVIGVIALLALVLVVGLVGFVTSKIATPGGPAVETPKPLSLELPLSSGEYSRDPNAATTPDPSTAKKDLDVLRATYVQDGRDSLVVLSGRPVKDPKQMLALADSRAIRDMGENSACGRTDKDLDVCVTVRENVGVMGVALQNQTTEHILQTTKDIAASLKRS